MDFLGYTYDKPSKRKNGKWKYVEIDYPDSQLFNEATGKLVRAFDNNQYRFIIADEDNNRYFIDVLYIRYNVVENHIRIWPHECRLVRR